MKTILTMALFALVASMMVAPAFADSKLDSFVNLANQARIQVKIQLDKMPSAPEEAKSLYAMGDSETEQLIASVKKDDAAEAKKHFLAAMKAFRQVTQIFSEPTPMAAKIVTPPPQAAPVPEFDYANALKRFEANINILKASANKNNLPVDFSRFDNLLQTAKTHLENDDMASLEKTFVELKNAGAELQATIKNMVKERSNTRAVSFANKYITKIDAVLAQAKELNLSEEQITKLQKAREELASAGDPTQVVIKIRHVYQINLDLLDAKNQKILSEISKLESRLLLLEPKVDDTIRPKFDSARSILASLKDPTSTDDPIKLLRALDSAIREIESYLLSLQAQPTANTQAAETPKETSRESFQLSDTRPQTEALKAETKDTKTQDKADKQDRQKSKDTNKKQPSEISKIEAKLAELEPHIDENIKPKFESAKSMLTKLKETGTESKKTIRAINALIDEITQYVESSDSEDVDKS
jgi:DNA-binding transcriptional regulator YbjK